MAFIIIESQILYCICHRTCDYKAQLLKVINVIKSNENYSL